MYSISNKESPFFDYIFNQSGFELVKQKRFAKNSEHSEEKGLPQTKNVLDLRTIL